MNASDRAIRLGFYAAGFANIGGVLLFSRAFTNAALNQAQPDVMSNFGLLSIILWGLAYLSVSANYRSVRFLVGLFAIEKLVYVVGWLSWILPNAETLGALYRKDFLAGAFMSVYGPNDFLFLLFFGWVFWKGARS